jgi:hypothetical protein
MNHHAPQDARLKAAVLAHLQTYLYTLCRYFNGVEVYTCNQQSLLVLSF